MREAFISGKLFQDTKWKLILTGFEYGPYSWATGGSPPRPVNLLK